jgi:D-inositol-3-phosphate glycosyltransferase
MLSVHTCPLAAPGGKQTGGMNVYVRELARELGRMGVEVDVYTRSQDPGIPRVVPLGERAHVIHLVAGPEMPLPAADLADQLDEFVDGVQEWRIVRGDYDLIYAHYWLSGVVALALRDDWSVPVLQMFHTLGRLKNAVARSAGEIEPLRRIEAETRLARAVDRVIAANMVEREHLVRHYGAEPARIATIPCGVDTELFRPGEAVDARRRLGLDGGPMVLYVGRLEPI